ncbi:MAG: hypothetical protein WEB57_00525 [Pseudohongiellaceae bacterium]
MNLGKAMAALTRSLFGQGREHLDPMDFVELYDQADVLEYHRVTGNQLPEVEARLTQWITAHDPRQVTGLKVCLGGDTIESDPFAFCALADRLWLATQPQPTDVCLLTLPFQDEGFGEALAVDLFLGIKYAAG